MAGILTLLLFATVAHSATKRPDSDSTQSDRREPATARDFYNEGTRFLSQSNLWRAEFSLQHSLDLQDPRFQPPALYNLGHIRFTQGAEELKKGPPAQRTKHV